VVASDLVDEAVVADDCTDRAAFSESTGIARRYSFGSDNSERFSHIVTAEDASDVVFSWIHLLLTAYRDYCAGFSK
jgi:hypothetical protein